MRQLVVMCDLDGVLADLGNRFRQRAEALDRCTYTSPQVWDFPVEQWGWTHERFHALLDEWAADGIFRDIPEHPESVQAIRRLLDAGVKVHFYTARNPVATVDTVDWLCERFGAQAWRWSFEVAQGPKVGGHRFYAGIDDYPGHAETLAATGCPNTFVCAQPWNRGTALTRVTVPEYVDTILSSLSKRAA